MVRRLFVPFFALLTLAAWPASAKPNFTGDWKLNASKSDFGQFPAPDSMSLKVSHEDPSLKIASKMSSSRGEFSWEASYTTDGKECINKFRDNPIKSVLKWDGDVLVIESNSRMGDNDLNILDRWALSEDGKTLTQTRRFTGPQGEATQKVVLEKQ